MCAAVLACLMSAARLEAKGTQPVAIKASAKAPDADQQIGDFSLAGYGARRPGIWRENRPIFLTIR
jgi:hypothetical protein